MMQRPINLRGPTLNLRGDIGDCAGGRPLWRKDLRIDLREPARSNRHTHARAHAHARDAAIRAIALVRVGAAVPSPASWATEARGNSARSIQSLFRLSGFRGGHRARPVGPWANGRSQGVPAYVPAALVPPGGVSGRWGPIPGPKAVRDTNLTKEVRDEDRATAIGRG